MSLEVLIMDDDPIVGSLVGEVLREAGYTTAWVKDCAQAAALIRESPPRLVILDIMIPGEDGISMLKSLKADPATRDIKCVVVSGKTYAIDKQRAAEAGADLFVEKPFNVDAFPETVAGVIGKPARPGQALPQAARQNLKIQIWGCRSPGEAPPRRSVVGGWGPCVLVEDPRRAFIFDAGSGLCTLGGELAERAPEKELWLLLTHAHPGHLEGLKNFPPAAAAGRVVKIAGPSGAEARLKDIVQGAFAGAVAPAKARIELYELKEGDFELAPGVKLSVLYAQHPGTTLALSLELDGKKIVYAADSELAGESAGAMHDYDEKLARFARGADILIHDAHFTEQDWAPRSGHSPYLHALRLAAHSQVRELWLFHLNPAYSDEKLAEIEADAASKAENLGFVCRLGREGLSETL